MGLINITKAFWYYGGDAEKEKESHILFIILDTAY